MATWASRYRRALVSATAAAASTINVDVVAATGTNTLVDIGFGNMVFVVVPQDDPWAGTKLIVTVIKREVIMNTIREFNYTGNRWRRMRHRDDLGMKPSLIKRKKWK